MELTILSPTETKTFNVSWIEVQTDQGSFIIEEGHSPTIVSIPENKELAIGFADGSTTIMNITAGILKVTRDSILLLLTHD